MIVTWTVTINLKYIAYVIKVLTVQLLWNCWFVEGWSSLSHSDTCERRKVRGKSASHLHIFAQFCLQMLFFAFPFCIFDCGNNFTSLLFIFAFYYVSGGDIVKKRKVKFVHSDLNRFNCWGEKLPISFSMVWLSGLCLINLCGKKSKYLEHIKS